MIRRDVLHGAALERGADRQPRVAVETEAGADANRLHHVARLRGGATGEGNRKKSAACCASWSIDNAPLRLNHVAVKFTAPRIIRRASFGSPRTRPAAVSSSST